MHKTIKIGNGWAGLGLSCQFRYNNIFEITVLKSDILISLY